MKFDSPKASEAHQALIKAAQNGGLDSLCLRRLLWLINAHPDLIGHGRVFEHVLAHLQSDSFHASALNWAGDWKSDIPEWIRLCTWITANHHQLARQPGLQALNRILDNKHPLVGEGVDRHGVPAALWSQHETCPNYPPARLGSTPSSLAYFGLQGHLLASYIECRYRLSTLDFYESHTKEDERPIAPSRTGVVGLAIRELSHNEYSPLLTQIPVCHSTIDFAERLKATVIRIAGLKIEVAEDGKRHLASICRYFQRFSRVLKGWEPPQNLKNGWGGSGGHARRHGFIHLTGPNGVYLQDPEPAPADPEIPRLVGQKILVDLDTENADDPNAVEASGLAPDETLEEVFQLYTPEQLKGRHYAARYQRLAAEASAQSLPFDYSQLTPQELQEVNALANARISHYVEGNSSERSARLNAIGGLIVRAMLCLGQPMREARSLRCRCVIDKSTDQIIEPVNGQITLIVAVPFKEDWKHARVIGFCMPGIMPTYKTSLPEKMEEIDQESVPSFVLPDVLGLGRQLLSFMRVESSTDLNGFGVHEQTAHAAVDNLVQYFQDKRITPDKIAKALPNIIKQQSGDQALAWIVAADARYANQARMHYTRYSVDVLVNTFRRASRRLARLIGVTQDVIPPTHSSSTGTATVGARFVIEKSEVQDLLTRLRDQLNERYQAKLSNREIRRYHSLYLLYTTIYQSILTSIRAVTAPNSVYLAWNQSDQRPGEVRASLSDKDSRYSDRARPITVIPALAEHFDHYTQHRQWLLNRLPLIGPWLAVLGELHPFFIITPDFRVEPLSPSWVKGALKEYTGYDIPANFHRPFIRTELLAQGCPAEIIDAYLGHANFGEVPHSRLSTFDYRLHFSRIQMELQRLHDDLGLRPIASRLVPHKIRIGAA